MTGPGRDFAAFGTQGASPPHGGGPIRHAGADLHEASGVVVLLHGRGASPHDILSLAPEFRAPHLCYLALAAANNSWYPHSFLAGEPANGPSVASAHEVLEACLERLREHGFGPERCVLGGFSQGACLALDHAYKFPRRYGLILAYTGGLIGEPDARFEPQGDLQGTPVDLSAGDADPFVPWPRVERTARVLEAMGASVDLAQYPGLPHTISRTQVERTREHLVRLFGEPDHAGT